MSSVKIKNIFLIATHCYDLVFKNNDIVWLMIYTQIFFKEKYRKISKRKVFNDGIKADYQRFQKGEKWQKQCSVRLF